MARDEAVELFNFSWPVPDTGYEWQDDAKADPNLGEGASPSPPFLVQSRLVQSPTRTCPILFDEPGDERRPLFDRFARLKPDRDSIKKFADENGALGIGVPIVLGNGKDRVVASGEPFLQWRSEIQILKEAVLLWSWLEGRRDPSVQIKHESKDSFSVQIFRPRWDNPKVQALSWEKLFHRQGSEGFFRFMKGEDVAPIVRAALLTKVNKKLATNASPCLMLDRHGHLNGYIRPKNLLSAMWTQLYQAIQGQRRLRFCAHCHVLMDVTGSRQSKKAHANCAHNAKMKRYRSKLASKNK